MARRGADPPGGPALRGRRSLRLRAGDDRAVDGATVVRAVVHARLLGMRLLTLDARVVVAPAEVQPTSLDLMTSVVVDDATGAEPAARSMDDAGQLQDLLRQLGGGHLPDGAGGDGSSGAET